MNDTLIFRIVCLFFFIVGMAHSVTGQEFVGESATWECRESGFYRIEITPAISSWLTSDFANLRLVDQNGQHVPYILQDGVEDVEEEFVEYKVDQKIKQGCCTTIDIENSRQEAITNVHLRIANADVRKTAALSGSNDRTSWFALRDYFSLYPVNSTTGISELRTVDFPLSQYRYYRLNINDSLSPPLNILAVGYYRTVRTEPAFNVLGAAPLCISDSLSLKKTFVTLSFDTSHWIDRLKISASGVPLFSRSAMVMEVRKAEGKKHRHHNRLIELNRLTISHTGDAVVDIPTTKASTLLLIVNNQDSPPLTDFSITPLQLSHYATAWLEQGKSYRLAIGTSKMDKPQYDLARFSDQVPPRMPSVTPGDIRVVNQVGVAMKDRNGWLSSNLMWIGIIGIMFLLGWMSFRMIRQVKT